MSVKEKSIKRIVIHLFDGAFGGQPDALNANQPWFGRDDITELYYRDWVHLKSVFTSENVKTQVGPDALSFSDNGSATSYDGPRKIASPPDWKKES
ncbi:hypothetical protein N7533_000575 [Penicillium manginii]|uniref:uncharacterized protein n=1 Tax=Penicillium manginii TaxID=203109 RepID=UPI002548690A|nr:uncharacterized protein N7533_000575 [Penicillium manginii]KAJ5767992.1 hypothetical protein N7533_000575 [Penicillium manginii]